MAHSVVFKPQKLLRKVANHGPCWHANNKREALPLTIAKLIQEVAKVEKRQLILVVFVKQNELTAIVWPDSPVMRSN